MKDYTQFLTQMKETKAIDLAFDFKPSPMTVLISEEITPTKRMIERVKYAVKISYGYEFDEYNIKSRLRDIVEARRAFTYYVRQKTNLSLKAIAKLFDGHIVTKKIDSNNRKSKSVEYIGMDHSSIIHAIREYNKFLGFDKKIQAKDNKIQSILNNV